MDVEDDAACVTQKFFSDANSQIIDEIRKLKQNSGLSSNSAIYIHFTNSLTRKASYKAALESNLAKQNEFECGGCSTIFRINNSMFLDGLICVECSKCYCKTCTEYLISNQLECEHK